MSKVLQLLSNQVLSSHLVCFPHAGGSASTFRNWDAQLSDLSVWGVKYPGRADRINEDYAPSIEVLGQEAAEVIAEQLSGDIILFGHSLGAAVAFETAYALEELNRSAVLLIVSGAKEGEQPRFDTDAPPETDEQLIGHLREMGGVASDLLDSADFREIILPYVRHDGNIFRRYTPSKNRKIDCTILGIVGDVDTHACIFSWGAMTNQVFQSVTVPGGHFYLNSTPPMTLIKSAQDKYSTKILQDCEE